MSLATHLQAAAAEHLVIGNLLVRGLQAFRAQANQPGYDVLVVQPETNKSIKIQVKSRAATDAGGFKISNWDFDLLILVRLNLGKRDGLQLFQPAAILNPEFYIVSRERLPEFEAQGDVKFRVSALPGHCRDNWAEIDEAFAWVNRRSNEGFYLDRYGRRRDADLYDSGVA